jgi:glycosyltransferase involved in cell wall biosynthesis
MSIAIHYTSVKPPTGQEHQVFGLQVAIADWLKAYFHYGSAEKFQFLIGDAAEWAEVQGIAAQAGLDPKRLVAFDRRFPEQNFSHFSSVFRPEPDTRGLLWQREFNGAFNFCGLAHAISGTEAGDVLQEYCLAPSNENDAIICPSRAVRAAVRAFWDHYGDYLQKRFSTVYRCPVQLPVIPLGVDVGKMAEKVTPDKRTAQRKKLGVEENDIVVLWVGRLSAAIKAHPLAMFQAAERAARKTGVRVHLVMVGYFVPDKAEGQFKKLAADICAQAKVTFIAANDKRFPDGLWAAGDIFLSLIDNMQESFGLTPIEAMVAGLPRVLSDWDGYRDSVTDGEDGFLIRTAQPPAGNGFDLTMQVLSGREVYGGFLAQSALTVAVDAEHAGDRLAQLIADKNLRMAMAEKARVRALATYDWKYIIPAYENLWGDLAACPHPSSPAREGRRSQEYSSALPQLADPYTMYEKFPTRNLREADRILLAASFEQIKILWAHDINLYAKDVLVGAQDIAAILGWLEQSGEVTISALFGRFPALDRPRLWRTVAWLQKLGIIKNSPCQTDG